MRGVFFSNCGPNLVDAIFNLAGAIAEFSFDFELALHFQVVVKLTKYYNLVGESSTLQPLDFKLIF